MTVLTRLAPAKVNLRLKINGRRDDGFHLIDSSVVFAELADRISLAASEHPILTISGVFADSLTPLSPEHNIISKAVAAFHSAHGTKQHYAITLEKNIPIAAGLGGGSADAAAVLLTLNNLVASPVCPQTLDAIAVSVGADVVVCLRSHQGCSWQMRAIGEEVIESDIPSSRGLVLLNNMEPVSTAAVFAQYDTMPDNSTCNDNDSDRDSDRDSDQGSDWSNDLLAPALAICPQIEATLTLAHDLQNETGFIMAGMSGSGATCFALFETAKDAIIAHTRLNNYAGWSWSGGLFAPLSLN